MCEDGRGIPLCDEEAVIWYRKAADQGFAKAQCNLAIMYEEGRGGLPKSEVMAAPLFQVAAERGNKDAAYNLGVYFERGCGGVDQSREEAKRWFAVAAKAGSGADDDKSGGGGGGWKGHPDGQFALALILLHEDATEKARGVVDATLGAGTSKHAQAVELLQAAADQHHALSQRELAKITGDRDLAHSAANDHSLVRLKDRCDYDEDDGDEDDDSGGDGNGGSGGGGDGSGGGGESGGGGCGTPGRALPTTATTTPVQRTAACWEKALRHGDVVVCKFEFMFGAMGDFFHWAIFDKERHCFIEFMGRQSIESSPEQGISRGEEGRSGVGGTVNTRENGSSGGGHVGGGGFACDDSGGFTDAGLLPPMSPTSPFSDFDENHSQPSFPSSAAPLVASVASPPPSPTKASSLSSPSPTPLPHTPSNEQGSSPSSVLSYLLGGSSPASSPSLEGSGGGGASQTASAAMGMRFLWGSGAVPLSNALVQATPVGVFVAHWQGREVFQVEWSDPLVASRGPSAVQAARARIGEVAPYNPVPRFGATATSGGLNCESFVRQCVDGYARSAQVEALSGDPDGGLCPVM